MPDPYAVLGLRHNPFVAEPVPGVDSQLWIERGYTPPKVGASCLVQVLGEKGAGKTSLLLRWREQAHGPYHYVAPNWHRWQLPPFASIVYWDELDRLPRSLLLLSLLWARRTSATVVAGTHTDLSWAAKLAGLSIRTVVFEPLDGAMIQAWAKLRIAAAGSGTASAVALSLDDRTAARIALEAGSSWRVAADLLHVWAAERAAGRTGRQRDKNTGRQEERKAKL